MIVHNAGSSGGRGTALFVAIILLATTPILAQAPPEMPPAIVVTAPVIQRQLNMGATFVGTVMPLRRSTVGSQVEGRVEQFLVNEGDRVSRGQQLAKLRAVTLELQMSAAKAELKLRQAELEEQERSAPKEIEQAKARMESAEAQVVFNDKRLKRFQELHERSRALSEDELEEQVYAAEAARNSYAEAKSAWELASSGMWDARIAQSRARVEVQQETIRQLADDIEQHTVVAPFDGYVTRENVEVGQWVTKGGPIVEMIEVDQVDVEVPVLERYEPKLRLGATATVEIEALRGRTWDGQIVSIVPQADARSRSFPVKVRLKNEATPVDSGSSVLIKPGMFARVTLPVGQEDAVTMVPKDALVLGADKPVVWLVTEDPKEPNQGTAVPVPVELGVSYGELIEVRGPLQPGQQVVVEGNERIGMPGRQVMIQRRGMKDEG